MTRPDPAAVVSALAGSVYVTLCVIAGWLIPAAIFAGLAAAGVITFWRVHEADDGIDALIAAITCRACRPEPGGPCTCGRDCGDLRCDRAPRDVVSR